MYTCVKRCCDNVVMMVAITPCPLMSRDVVIMCDGVNHNPMYTCVKRCCDNVVMTISIAPCTLVSRDVVIML